MAGAQGLEPWARGFGAYGKTLKFQYLQVRVTPWVTPLSYFYTYAAYGCFLFRISFLFRIN